MKDDIKLTQFSHGAGCGCKIAPQVLEEILGNSAHPFLDPSLLVGNSSKDDAAVYQLNDSEALVATTDFFTPIVDDPYTFGQVAAANAISDIYAMGGQPILALAILGWPIETLPAHIAQKVLEGARNICEQAKISLAGGHSIDSKEPIFGLAVNGLVKLKHLKQNNKAQAGDVILLTKALGLGALATAVKRAKANAADIAILHHELTQLNTIGKELGALEGVHAMTDVTGFGLAGHLIEMAEGAALSAHIVYDKLPKLAAAINCFEQNIMPDATFRNWKSYHQKIQLEPSANAMEAFKLLPDPQTNGGLLIALNPEALPQVQVLLQQKGYGSFIEPIGHFTPAIEKALYVS